jgi:hypothetical protein
LPVVPCYAFGIMWRLVRVHGVLAQTTGFMKKNFVAKESENDDEVPFLLLEAVAKLCNIFVPVSSPTQCNEPISTNDIYQIIFRFYPSDEYTPDTIADLLQAENWQIYYNPVLEEYFWQVKKISSDL